MNRFTGRVAFVTGAGSGIGRGVARRLAAEGARVCAVDLDAAAAAATVRLLAGAEHLALTVDVTDAEAIAAAARTCRDDLDRLDVAVACAGIFRTGSLLDLEPGDFRQQVDVNLTGVFATARAAARQMVDLGNGGRIVVLSSEAALTTGAKAWAYSATKAAIDPMVRGWAQELGPYGITVNNVAPGLIDTPLSLRQAGRPGGPLRAVAERGRAVGRIGTVDDVAAVVAFLASDEAGYVTGAFVLADGGARDAFQHVELPPDAREELAELRTAWHAYDGRTRALLDGDADAGPRGDR